MLEVITDFKIKEKIYFVGTDNGANIVKAFEGWLPGFMCEFEAQEEDFEENDDIGREERVNSDELVFDGDVTVELRGKILEECPQTQFALSDHSILVSKANGYT